MGQFFDDDISVPPPREIKTYYCSSCGEPGAVPDPSFPVMDKRFVVGKCPCTKPTRRLGKSYGGMVQLVADIAWDQRDFDRRQLESRMKKAFQSQMNGVKLKPEEAELAARWRVRLGLTNDNG